ncbi:MAG: DNA primase [Methanosphaera sp.]|nr:DNA primase [Methanosphaera sp.]
MIKTSFVNPFSTDAKEIVSRLGQIDSIDKYNEDLINIIKYSGNQQFDIPTTIKDLSISKYEWYQLRNTDNYDEKKYRYLFDSDIYEYDVVSFYLLCQAIAIGYGSDSHEANIMINLEGELISQRLDRLRSEPNNYQEIYIRETLSQLYDTNNLYWYDIKDVLEIGEINLDELILSNGRIIIEYEDFHNEYAHMIEHRNPQSLYNATCGLDLKIKLIKSTIMFYTKQYIENVEAMSDRMVEPNPIMTDIAQSLKDIQKEVQIAKFGSATNRTSDNQPVPFNMDAFPPCVKKCMEGIKSGGRNDAIVLFLTPFISYARLYPGVFKLEGQTIKVSDVDTNLDITNSEVIPLIYEAANNCRPPLFKDQPQEKININSKLGFGMHDSLQIENEGQTRWYTPMSCEKIKLHLPNLCIPCKDCKKIGNPLTYYNRMRAIQSKQQNTNTSGDNSGD